MCQNRIACYVDIIVVIIVIIRYLCIMDTAFEPLKGYESQYEINRIGQVRCISKILRDCSNREYRQLGLTNIHGICKCERVHRLIAIQFIPNPENKPYVNHINGIRNDNRIENLEWCTQPENIEHYLCTGLKKSIVRTLSDATIKDIIAKNKSNKDLISEYNITKPIIDWIRKSRCIEKVSKVSVEYKLEYSKDFEPMKGYEDLYEINYLGQIRNKPKLLAPRLIHGYVSIGIRSNGKSTTAKVHRLLAKQFIDNPDNKPYVNHKNLNRLDNRLENLEWCTQKENVQHAIMNGRIGGNFKLTQSDVDSIRSSNKKQIELASLYNVTQTTISDVKLNKSWI